jgi:TolA-binding protein
MKSNRTRLVVLTSLLWTLPVAAWAQDLEAERQEVTIDAVGTLDEPERGGTLEEARSGPEAIRATEFEEVLDVEFVERTGTARSRLQGLVDGTPATDPQRADYMFRLAELYYDLARYYEERGFAQRDEAFETRNENPQRSRALEENAVADLAQSDQYADQAILLYAGIYREYAAVYPDIDAVLYYLGVNMLQRERNEEARVIFEELAVQYPRSPFLPQALLMLGELDFAEGYMDTARRYYADVVLNPDSSVYPYALYKLAWCDYNLANSPEGFELALQELYDTVQTTNARIALGENRERLRRDALRDMTLFYSEVYPAEAAVGFFQEVAPDIAYDLLARLARIYGDKGLYDDSSMLYRELIATNSQSVQVISYQLQIVNNTRPSGNEVEIVRELTRLLELYSMAQSFSDYDPALVMDWGTDIELIVRILALTYYREAQTMRSEQFYALAYELFEAYNANFPETESSYVMWFLYGELLYYHQRNYLESARAYENALMRSDGSGEYDEGATYNACHAYLNMVDTAAAQAVESGNQMAQAEQELPPIPEPQEITEDYARMMTACDRYLGTSPTMEDAVQIEFVTAYMYYMFDHLDEAADRFSRIAMQYNTTDTPRAQLSATLLLDSLAILRRFDDMKTWIDMFKATPAIYQGNLAVQLDGLSESIDFKQCRDLQTTERFIEAGECYLTFVQTHSTSTLLDKAFYNAAVAFEDGNQLGMAIVANQFLVEYVPDSELVPETTYLLGQTYYRMALYERAAGYYEQYVDGAPDGDYVRDALINATICRRGLGQYDQAIENIRTFVRYNDEDVPEQAQAIAEAAWTVAEVYRQEGDLGRALSQYELVIDEYAGVLPSRAQQAFVLIAEIYEERGQPDRALSWYQQGADFWASVAEEARAAYLPAGRDAAAKAHFMLGEQIFAEFEGIEFRGNEEAIQAAYATMVDAGARAQAAYTLVIPIGSPGWSVAAFTRVGRLYQVFYEKVIDSPTPEGLSLIEEEEYRSQVEERAAAQKEIAMQMYGNAIETARSAGYFSEFAEEAAARYQELDPTFKAGTETVVDPGYSSFAWFAAPWVSEQPEAEVTEAPIEAGEPAAPDAAAP